MADSIDLRLFRNRGDSSTMRGSTTRRFTGADIDQYVRAYAAPGAMRAGFELYRAFPEDVRDNKALMRARLEMPVLAMGGTHSTSGPLIEEMMREVANDVTGALVPDAAHWLPEENPEFVIDRLLAFL